MSTLSAIELLNQFMQPFKDGGDFTLYEEIRTRLLRAEQAEADKARLQARLERATDLVRYQRQELHTTGLITNEEFAELVQVEGAVERLEGYDASAKRIKELQARVEELEEELKALKPAHEWGGCRQGGDPAEAGSYEWVRYCKRCGMEDTCEDPLPPCVTDAEAKLARLPADWEQDSSLETWFPLTAERIATLEAQLKQTWEDSRMLDWLDGEMAREQEMIKLPLEQQPKYPHCNPLFRRNIPITRDAIRAAMDQAKQEETK